MSSMQRFSLRKRSSNLPEPEDALPPETVYSVLLAPSRITALHYCDRHLSSYEPSSFWIVFQCQGRRFDLIAGVLFCLLLWDIGWGIFLVHYDSYGIGAEIQRMEDLVTSLLTPVSFLLVFRLGRAGVRYWEARAAVGTMVGACRTCISSALVATAAMKRQSTTATQAQQYQQYADDFARWVTAFPISIKNFLRKPDGDALFYREQEIGHLLLPHDKVEFMKLQGHEVYAPIMVINKLRQIVYDFSNEASPAIPKEGDYRNQQAHSPMAAMVFRQLNEHMDVLTGTWGACERISGTPLPFVYVVHLRTLLLIYLFVLNLEAIALQGWIAVPPLMLINWGLLGIEAAAVECERPFQWQSNHLPLGKTCIVVAKNVAQTMENVGLVVPSSSHSDDSGASTELDVPRSRVGLLARWTPQHDEDEIIP